MMRTSVFLASVLACGACGTDAPPSSGRVWLTTFGRYHVDAPTRADPGFCIYASGEAVDQRGAPWSGMRLMACAGNAADGDATSLLSGFGVTDGQFSMTVTVTGTSGTNRCVGVVARTPVGVQHASMRYMCGASWFELNFSLTEP